MSVLGIDRQGTGCVDVLAEALAVSGSDDVAAVLVKAADPWGFRLDTTRSAALLAVTQGACVLRRPAARPVELRAGDLCLVPITRPGSGLASALDGDLAPYDATFSGSSAVVDLPGHGATTSLVYVAYEPLAAARRLLTGLPGVVAVERETADQRGVLAESIHLLCAELVRDDPGARTAINRLVDVLLVHLLRAWMAYHPNGSWYSAATVDQAVTTAVDRIRTEPARPWTIEKLAAEVGISRASFVRRFTTHVGEPPASYLTRWRLATAARRMRRTTEPLVAISRDVGYSSEFTFSRAFSRAFGQPPGKYRTEARRRAKE